MLSAAESRIDVSWFEKIGRLTAETARSIRNVMVLSAFPNKLRRNLFLGEPRLRRYLRI